LKVGLYWTGRADHSRNDLRSVAILELMEALRGIAGVTLYSLQVGKSEEAAAAGLIDFTSEFKSFEDTAAFISDLELVITIDGVIAHLAGALALPAWVLVDVNPHYCWCRVGQETPWYPSARIYRQTAFRQWRNVYAEIRNDLKTICPFQSRKETSSSAPR
jgi:ADP-heptose:LPS heptosyltransferase